MKVYNVYVWDVYTDGGVIDYHMLKYEDRDIIFSNGIFNQNAFDTWIENKAKEYPEYYRPLIYISVLEIYNETYKETYYSYNGETDFCPISFAME